MRIAGLVTSGSDGVGGDGTGGEAGGLDGEFQAFAGEGLAFVDEGAAFDLAGAENSDGGGDAERATAAALAEGGDLGGSFNLAVGKERAGGDDEIEA